MATMKQVFGAMKKGLATGNFTLNGLVQTLQNYCEQLENSTGGGGGGSTVEYSQTATTGGECGTITIDGTAKKIYAPLQNASAVGYNNTSSGLTADDVQEAIDELNTKEGDLNDLTTTAKTSLVAAINEAAQGGGGVGTWSEIGNTLGSSAITIPVGTSELSVSVKIQDADSDYMNTFIVAASLSATTHKFRIGYTTPSSNKISVSIDATSSSINLASVKIDGTDHTADSRIIVYAR